MQHIRVMRMYHISGMFGVYVIAMLLAGGVPAFAQESGRLLETDHHTYTYLLRLQERGHLSELHPTNLPWNYGEIRTSLEALDPNRLHATEQRWYEQLTDYFLKESPAPESVTIGGEANFRATRINSDRVNTLRPVGEGEPILPAADTRVFMQHGNFVAQAGVRFDAEYLHDPDAVDLTHRLYGRPEHFYAGYNGDFFGLYAGRYSQHWGRPGQPAGAVTDNPRPYDRFSFRIGGTKLALRSLVGELDNLGPSRDYFDRESFKEDAIRRYISMHRLDWRPTPDVALTLYEGVIYAGYNTSFSLQYVNPLQFMAIGQDSDPKNEYANLIMGAMGWWRFGPGVFWAEFMLDDVIVDDREALKARRDLKPAATAWSAGLTLTGLHPELEVSLQGQMISSTAYRPQLFRGQWTYAQRGLATNFGDYIHTGAEVGWFADRLLPGLEIRPGLDLLWQGEGDIRMHLAINEPDIAQMPLVLSGTVEHTARPYLKTHYQPHPRFRLETDIGINYIRNRGHRTGINETPLIGKIRAVFTLDHISGFSQDW